MCPNPHASAIPPAAARGRILVVEDDEDAALFMKHVLEKRGRFDVTHTPDPAAALALATAEPWDLVITDLDLPSMSGRELTGALRRVDPSLPVVLVTACEAAARGPARADAVLIKPLRVNELLTTATALIGARPHPGKARLSRPRKVCRE
jgi:two-component system, cell cycle sensor histidine kinase and response regulator CckA